MPVLHSNIPWPQGFHRAAEGTGKTAKPEKHLLLMPGDNTVSDEDFVWLKVHPDFRDLVSKPKEYALPPLRDGSPQRFRGIPITSPGQSVSLV